MQFKGNLKRLLFQNDLTASQLSRATKVPQATLSGWINGVPPKNLTQLKKVANYFSVSIDELIFGELENVRIKTDNKIMEKYGSEIIAGEFLVILKPIKKQGAIT